MILRNAIGQYLRGERHAQGLTLRDVAGLAGVSLGYVSEVERGRKESSSELLDRMVATLLVKEATEEEFSDAWYSITLGKDN